MFILDKHRLHRRYPIKRDGSLCAWKVMWNYFAKLIEKSRNYIVGDGRTGAYNPHPHRQLWHFCNFRLTMDGQTNGKSLLCSHVFVTKNRIVARHSVCVIVINVVILVRHFRDSFYHPVRSTSVTHAISLRSTRVTHAMPVRSVCVTHAMPVVSTRVTHAMPLIVSISAT